MAAREPNRVRDLVRIILRWRHPLPVFLAVSATAVGCSAPAAPTLSPERVTVTRIDAQGVGLRLQLTATNPNTRDLSVRQVSSRIVIDKTHDIGQVTVPGEIVLPAGKTTELDVPVSLNWREIGLLAQLAASGDAVPYAVDGALALGMPLSGVAVPFQLQGSISHDQIVNAAVNSLPWLGR
ncbi:MAG: LEA type 2 family protein [Myxococcota bacterium]|nr:LEA type 2 family protein [Myxococcota bacterium]